MQVTCKYEYEVLADGYIVYISNWDDGDYGKSIKDTLGRCHLSLTAWTYEPDSSYTFKDGTKNSHKATFGTAISTGGLC